MSVAGASSGTTGRSTSSLAELVEATPIERERELARRRAIESLSRYKFQMFGYWAAIWVHLNRLCPDRQPNPFAHIVKAAREGGAA